MLNVSRITPEAAEGEVDAIYKEIARWNRGWVPDFYQVLAHRPPLLANFWKMQLGLALKGKIAPQHRELVTVFVSLKNRCEYCLYHHSAFGLSAGLKRAQLNDLGKYSESPLFNELEKLLLRYAQEYLERKGASPEVVEALKRYYNEEQIVELEVILGSVNLANHFVASMGIEVEIEHTDAHELNELHRRMEQCASSQK